MKNLKVEPKAFVSEGLLYDISVGKRKFSLQREFVKFSAIPLGAITTAEILNSALNTPESKAYANLIMILIGSLMLEFWVVFRRKFSHDDKLRKSLLNIQDLINDLRGMGIETNIPDILDSLVLKTSLIEESSSKDGKKNVDSAHITNHNDIIFYDRNNRIQVIRQTTKINRNGKDHSIEKQWLSLMEYDDKEYTEVINRTRTKLIAR